MTGVKNVAARSHEIKIANPIYDTVFKYLMENRRVARFLHRNAHRRSSNRNCGSTSGICI